MIYFLDSADVIFLNSEGVHWLKEAIVSINFKDSSNNTLYSLPDGFHLVDYGTIKRLDSEERILQHGNVIVGDKYLNDRPLTLTGIFSGTSLANFESELTLLKRAIHRTDVRLYGAYKTDQFFKIKALQSSIFTFLNDGALVEAEIILAADPFRYTEDETSDQETIDEASHSYTLTNDNDGDIEVNPKITFICGAGSGITKIKIQNSSDSDKYFEYIPASALTSGKVVVVNCANASCSLDGNDDIENFSGAFFNLRSGDNSIVVTLTGTAGENILKFEFRKRYL